MKNLKTVIFAAVLATTTVNVQADTGSERLCNVGSKLAAATQEVKEGGVNKRQAISIAKGVFNSDMHWFVDFVTDYVYSNDFDHELEANRRFKQYCGALFSK